MKDLTQIKTSELIALYNRLAKKNIKKFSDRATGIEQVRRAIKNTGACPCCFASNKSVVLVDDEKQEFRCKECKKHFVGEQEVQPAQPAEQEKHAVQSSAIKNSWKNPETAAKRAKRDHVVVNGNQYRSVKEAFEKLELPMGQHIKIRMQLKKEGVLDFRGNHFEIAKAEQK